MRIAYYSQKGRGLIKEDCVTIVFEKWAAVTYEWLHNYCQTELENNF